MPKLIILANHDYFLLSHRTEITRRAVEEGYEVVVVAKDTGRSDEIRALGARFIEMVGNPAGMNPLEELKTLNFLVRLYKKEKPDIVHHVVLKNVLWGTFASRLARVPGVVNAITGLGVMFNMPIGLKAKMIMKLIGIGSRRKNLVTIFQNKEDRQLFLENNVVKEEVCLYTKGSGVNLDQFAYRDPVEKKRLIVLFSARMVEEKGVKTLVEAARILEPEWRDKMEFHLCGDLTTNPNALPREWFDANCDGDYVKWLGGCSDMPANLAECDIMAFPSKYREGVPKAVIEACSVGRPIVTTDSVGCRDTVDDGVNGFLVPVDDARALADKIALLAGDRELRLRMGHASRLKAEREFDVRRVVETHMKAYRTLIENAKS